MLVGGGWKSCEEGWTLNCVSYIHHKKSITKSRFLQKIKIYEKQSLKNICPIYFLSKPLLVMSIEQIVNLVIIIGN